MLRPAVATLLAVLLGLTACESPAPEEARPTPTPSPAAVPTPREAAGLAVGVVLAPPGTRSSVLDDEVRLAADSLARGAALTAVRVLAPPDEDFRSDQLIHLVEEGADVVCAVGEGARETLASLATRHPRTAFCLIDGGPEPEQGLLVVNWDEDGVAFLAGAAAAMAGGDGAAVGLVVLEGAPEEVRADAFSRGVATVDEERRVEVLAVEASDEPQDLRAGLADAVAARDEEAREEDQEAEDGAAEPADGGGEDRVPPLDVIAPMGPPDLLRAAVGFAQDDELGIVGVGTDLASLLDDDAAEVVVVSIVRRARPVLDRVVRAVSDEDVALAGVVRLGVDDGLSVRPGGAEGAVGVAERTVTLSDRVAAGEVGP